jgi:hypothetical protein
LEPSREGVSLECLDQSDSRRYLEVLKAAVAARWKLPIGIEPFPSVVADLRFGVSGIVTIDRIVEATHPNLIECARNALADLAPAPGPVPGCLVGNPVRLRVLVPWGGAPDDLFSSAPSPQEKETLRELGYIE